MSLKIGKYLITRHYYECPVCLKQAWIEDDVTDTDSSKTDVTECVCQFCAEVFPIDCGLEEDV